MNENLLNEVRQFIINERWDYDFVINLETSIQDDLKIYGDDASEFLMKFCRKYEIDYSNFKFDDYFSSEPNWSDFFKKDSTFKNFTISSLILAIKSKKLS